MERLVARFTMSFSEPILVEDRQGAIHTFKVAHGEYEIEATWGNEDVRSRKWKPGSRRPRYGISRLEISMSRPETESYPEGVDERNAYLTPRLETYACVAAIIINRLIRYFKFTLGNPLLQEVTPQNLIASNPEWTDENGTSLRPATVYVVAEGFAGLRYSPAFGIKAFTPAQSHALENALQADSSYELYEELMADARAALVQENFRRAVLEMAIACEVATKQLFSEKGRRARSNILVALHTGAKEAFGTSFYESNPKDWHNIKDLFECRNDVAHGTPQDVDYETLRDWWDSLDALIAWIRSK
jgi:hypothetical protein